MQDFVSIYNEWVMKKKQASQPYFLLGRQSESNHTHVFSLPLKQEQILFIDHWFYGENKRNFNYLLNRLEKFTESILWPILDFIDFSGLVITLEYVDITLSVTSNQELFLVLQVKPDVKTEIINSMDQEKMPLDFVANCWQSTLIKPLILALSKNEGKEDIKLWPAIFSGLLSHTMPVSLLPWLTALIHKNTNKVSHFIAAQNRVISQLLEALILERLISINFLDSQFTVLIDDKTTIAGSVLGKSSFDRLRVDKTSFYRLRDGILTTITIGGLLVDLSKIINTEPNHYRRFSNELMHTFLKHAWSTMDGCNLLLRDMSYINIESRLSNGHLYHPMFKTRQGFSFVEHQKYCPESAEPFELIWLSVDSQFINKHFISDYIENIMVDFSAADKKNSKVLMPVHPWQWFNHLQFRMASALDSGSISLVKNGKEKYLPQQSIRTLSNVSDIEAPSIKCAMHLLNTSTIRTLASHTIYNAPRISAWLDAIVKRTVIHDKYPKPILLKEFAGIEIHQCLLDSPLDGGVSCIFRESIMKRINSNQVPLPFTALTQVDNDGLPVIYQLLENQTPTHFLTSLFNHCVIPVLHMLWAEGIAFEAHAQNMVIVIEDGLPACVALKDFHDGVRYFKPALSNKIKSPELMETPDSHKKVNVDSYLQAKDPKDLMNFVISALFFTNLSEFSWFLNVKFDLAENDFWHLLKVCILEYQETHSELKNRFDSFDIFSSSIYFKQLASRRCFNDDKSRMDNVTNPLSNEWLAS